MAKAITKIEPLVADEETRRQEDIQEIEELLADHKEAIHEAVRLIGHLHEAGLLSLLNGVFSQSDEVVRILVQELNKPSNASVLQNGIGLAGIIGMLDIDRLKTMTEKMNAGLKEATEGESEKAPTSVFQLLKAFKDPEINESIGMMLSFFKGMGRE